MTDTLEITLRLVATGALIGINALYVFHEFAFVGLKPRQIRRLDEDRSGIGQLISRTAHNLDHYIAVDQLGITASSLAVGWVGQPVVTDLFTSLFGELGLSSAVMTAIAALIAFALLTGTQMIVGELMPKTYALRSAESTARWVARPIEWTAKIFHPFVLLLNGIGLWLVRLMGFEGRSESHAQVMPAEELVTIVQSSARAGMLTVDPRALNRLLNFSDLRANDLMVPRVDMVAISTDATIEQVVRTAQRHQFDKYPVYQGSVDYIVGMVSVRGVLVAQARASEPSADWHQHIASIPTLPERASVEMLLRTFQQTQRQMVLLVDEYGATEGIVTVSDVIEQLIEGPDEIHAESPQGIRVDGHASLAVIEAELGLSLSSEAQGTDTVAGLVFAGLGRVPEIGDTVTIDGHTIEVVEMDGQRIIEVRLRPTRRAGVVGDSA